MSEIPWLLVAFASGSVFGGAIVIALLMMIIDMTPFTAGMLHGGPET